MLKQTIEHKMAWKKEIEEEFAQKGETVNVSFV